ncbi:MAG: dihydropteroate synthase [Pseudomonadota bacterium]
MKLIERIHNAAGSRKPLVMGIVNITPDSFSDGGRFVTPEDAVKHAAALVAAGADILDIGGESTRPGAEPVDEQQELDRVLPVIEALRTSFDTPISIDTMKPEVMRQSVAAGAAMINDVNGLRASRAMETAARLGVPVCIMHMQGQPRTMQASPEYTNVVDEVFEFFVERSQAAAKAGIRSDHVVLDPGFGFGKTLQHNLALLAALERFSELGPLLIGISRKSMLGQLTGREPAENRVAASVAAALLAADRGAAIVRAHDVAETVDALKVRAAILDAQIGS